MYAVVILLLSKTYFAGLAARCTIVPSYLYLVSFILFYFCLSRALGFAFVCDMPFCAEKRSVMLA